MQVKHYYLFHSTLVATLQIEMRWTMKNLEMANDVDISSPLPTYIVIPTQHVVKQKSDKLNEK